MNIVFILVIFISSASPSVEQQPKGDAICNITRDVLCVKDVLMIIATAIRSINRTTNEIEKYILNNIQIIDTLNRRVNFEMVSLHSQLPIPQYHIQFFQLNNIDKKYLGHLFSEAHHATSFYYNSIDDILRMHDVYAFTSDSWWKQVEHDLRSNVICQYRSVLNVYSREWKLIDDINRIEFSNRKYRSTASLVHEVHSIIIARLLRQWMQILHSVIINLEKKFR